MNCTAPLSPPRIGTISDHSVPALPGTQVTFKCDNGFPEGIMNTTCLATGEWEKIPEEIVCKNEPSKQFYFQVYNVHPPSRALSFLCPICMLLPPSSITQTTTLRTLTQSRAQSLPSNVILGSHWWVQRLPLVTTLVSGILTRLYGSVSHLPHCLTAVYIILYAA